MSGIDASKYAHSSVHKAILTKDYVSLRNIIACLPRLRDPNEIITEEDSLAEEEKADAISSVVDCREVPNRETPLHLSVKLGDATATEMLITAGADWSLQNGKGWSALQEAICLREERLAMIMVRHYHPHAWAKWCRRLPRLIGTMHRMRDFYMEITFHFESSVIPFIGRIAPSDTYKIWKRGSNFRADMTLAGFDGFRIQRSDQSIIFLGDGSEDGKIPRGSLCVISHKDKEVMNAMEGASSQASESDIQKEVAAMSQTNVFRPGMDVTQAVLVPQLTWRRQEKTEMVGSWKSKVYDMHHVTVSVKSRSVPGAMTDDELFYSCNENDTEVENYDGLLTEDEKSQLENALNTDSSPGDVSRSDGFVGLQYSFDEQREICIQDTRSGSNGKPIIEKKGWFGNRGKWGSRCRSPNRADTPRISLSMDGKANDLCGDSLSKPARHSIDVSQIREDSQKEWGENLKESSLNIERRLRHIDSIKEREYKKGLKPTLWLSPNFPLKIEELLPLLDILANKVKAVRRLREVLTTKLPPNTFPVKVAIPVVPTIRVLVTFTKFEELHPLEEFVTPPSSPDIHHSTNQRSPVSQPSTSWFQWMKPSTSTASGSSNRIEDIQDPFMIPAGYTWTKVEKKKLEIKKKSKKARSHHQ